MSTAQPAKPAGEIPYPNQTYAWVVVGVLILAAFVAYIDRQVVAIVVDEMKTDLNVGDSQIGWLYGVFAVFYAIAGVPIAWLADHKSRKHIIAIGIFFWSLMTMACGLTRSFWYVLLARIGVGVGEAALTPATNSLIGDYFPRHRIPLALSVVQAGPIMGTGIAFIIGGIVVGVVETSDPLVLPYFGEMRPWQQTFLYVGAPGLILAFLFLLIREPLRRPVPKVREDGSDAGSLAALLDFYKHHARLLVPHHIGFLCFGLYGYAFVFWTVTLFVRVHGAEFDLGRSEVSTTFGWIFLFAGPLGPIVIAMFAERLTRIGRKDANILAPMIGSAIGVVVIILVPLMPTPNWKYVLYVPASMLVNAPFAMAYASLTVITPAPLRARVAAVYMFVVSFGMMLGPPIAGIFNEQIFPEADGVRWSIITVTAIFGVIGVLALMFTQRPYAKALEEVEAAEAAAA